MRIIEEQLSLLEETLVSEFRLLQSLIEITQKESSALLKGSHSILMPIVENKEAILDQLGALEDTRAKNFSRSGERLWDRRPTSYDPITFTSRGERTGRAYAPVVRWNPGLERTGTRVEFEREHHGAVLDRDDPLYPGLFVEFLPVPGHLPTTGGQDGL